jgi:hypothetical protein
MLFCLWLRNSFYDNTLKFLYVVCWFVYSETLNASQKYYLGPLTSEDKIDDGFFDPGHQKDNESLPSLESLTSLPLNLEVLFFVNF